MSAKSQRLVSATFMLSGIYDGLLGAVFLVFAPKLFAAFGVTPPNHYGYIQFPAALLIVFAIMFIAIARKPKENRNLMPYGIMLKLSYCLIVFSYWFTRGIPILWKPFAVIDAAFAMLFYWSWKELGK